MTTAEALERVALSNATYHEALAWLAELARPEDEDR